MENTYTITYTEAVNPVVSKKMYIAQRIYIIFWAVILSLSVILSTNLLRELNMISKIFLALIGTFLFKDLANPRIPSDMQVTFTDDYLEIFREKHIYSPYTARQERYTFAYSDVVSCIYDETNQKLTIKGKYHDCVTKYKKDGTLEDIPCFDDMRDGFQYFYTNLGNIDLLQEIENHSPLKIEREERK